MDRPQSRARQEAIPSQRIPDSVRQQRNLAMVNDRELVQALNLLRGSPTFVLRQRDNRLEVSQIALVPNDQFVYWIAGESKLPAGRTVPSAFIVESGGGNLVAVYWFVNGGWRKPSDPDTLETLGLRREEVFPFDWLYAVPVENDVYHAEQSCTLTAATSPEIEL